MMSNVMNLALVEHDIKFDIYERILANKLSKLKF
jgi:hypothetical protein